MADRDRAVAKGRGRPQNRRLKDAIRPFEKPGLLPVWFVLLFDIAKQSPANISEQDPIMTEKGGLEEAPIGGARPVVKTIDLDRYR
jgi:hypothetical protein